MTDEEVEEFYFPAFANLIGNDPTISLWDYRLEDLIGIYHIECDNIPLPDNIKQLLRAFAGPHGKTMFRVYQIQKGLIHAES
jgi:hypothetical protein